MKKQKEVSKKSFNDVTMQINTRRKVLECRFCQKEGHRIDTCDRKVSLEIIVDGDTFINRTLEASPFCIVSDEKGRIIYIMEWKKVRNVKIHSL